jgi:hypothetical protein
MIEKVMLISQAEAVADDIMRDSCSWVYASALETTHHFQYKLPSVVAFT